MEYDVLVLGGGTAGCVLAARLSEEPSRSVCLVEAGPDYGSYAGGRWPDDMLDGRRLAFSHSWETDREDRSQLRARILGGCSAHNACVVLPGAPADYDEWGPGWTYPELRPYLERAEGELRTRRPPDEEISPWGGAWLEAAPQDGFVNPRNAVGAVRWNAAFAYIDSARDRPNLTIRANTLVDRVLLDGQRAVGAITSAGELRAALIVLTASTYGSPAILLRSGIGPEHGLPVGEGLIDHVGVGAAWEPTELLLEETRAFEAEHPLFLADVTVALRSTSCPELIRDLFMFPAIEIGETGYEISGAAFVMKPRSRGRVGLNDTDPATPLVIEHGFLSDPHDADVLTEGFELLRDLAAGEPVRRYAGRESRPGAEVSAQEHVLAEARGFFHPVGTCAMGAVVDSSGRVLGFENLVVADASIMPTIPTANTNLTTAAIAEKIADVI